MSENLPPNPNYLDLNDLPEKDRNSSAITFSNNGQLTSSVTEIPNSLIPVLEIPHAQVTTPKPVGIGDGFVETANELINDRRGIDVASPAKDKDIDDFLDAFEAEQERKRRESLARRPRSIRESLLNKFGTFIRGVLPFRSK